jgi:hypothetical protein
MQRALSYAIPGLIEYFCNILDSRVLPLWRVFLEVSDYLLEKGCVVSPTCLYDKF